MIDWSFLKQAADRIAAAEERQASALEVIAGVVDEIYKEQQQEESERLKTVAAREVTKVSSAPPAPRVPRARANV